MAATQGVLDAFLVTGLVVAPMGLALLVEVSSVAVVGVFALVAFHLFVGWKVHRLPGSP